MNFEAIETAFELLLENVQTIENDLGTHARIVTDTACRISRKIGASCPVSNFNSYVACFGTCGHCRNRRSFVPTEPVLQSNAKSNRLYEFPVCGDEQSKCEIFVIDARIPVG